MLWYEVSLGDIYVFVLHQRVDNTRFVVRLVLCYLKNMYFYLNGKLRYYGATVYVTEQTVIMQHTTVCKQGALGNWECRE